MSTIEAVAELRVALEPVGDARGVRLPEALIEACGLEGGIDIEVRDHEIVLRKSAAVRKPRKPRRPRAPREGWDEAFRKAIAKHGPPDVDHEFLDMPNRFDEEEWTWPGLEGEEEAGQTAARPEAPESEAPQPKVRAAGRRGKSRPVKSTS